METQRNSIHYRRAHAHIALAIYIDLYIRDEVCQNLNAGQGYRFTASEKQSRYQWARRQENCCVTKYRSCNGANE